MKSRVSKKPKSISIKWVDISFSWNVVACVFFGLTFNSWKVLSAYFSGYNLLSWRLLCYQRRFNEDFTLVHFLSPYHVIVDSGKLHKKLWIAFWRLCISQLYVRIRKALVISFKLINCTTLNWFPKNERKREINSLEAKIRNMRRSNLVRVCIRMVSNFAWISKDAEISIKQQL